ncbi:GLABROUS1 enhancer-binding protein-like [Rutidosis leptorrhynchoides]|uniref:GLABROUS1 enhancer-binding protein-like n=1 Tax=Rutidosis leptorrhynchoides TaxID=125765 RepID=UPI003A99EB77
MAHKRQPESNPSSSDEEEEASGSEEEQFSGSEDEQSSGSEDEQKHEKAPVTPSQAPQSINKSQDQDQSSENEDSGSETDSDSDSPPAKSAVADPKIKPISSKPMVRDEKPKTDFKNPNKSKTGSVTASKNITTAVPAKRAAPVIEKEAKKAKSNAVTDDDSKKQLFQRLWSEDDEIAILQGMIDYKNENGESPVNDMGAFHEYIKKSLHVDVSRAQLVDKVRRLKKKYVNNASREKSSREKNGKDRSFSKSHEQKGYELSKLVWGGSGGDSSSGVETKKIQSQKNGNNIKGNAAAAAASASTVAKSNGVVVKEESVTKDIDINRFVQYGKNNNGSAVLEEEIMKGGMELVEGSKREELENKWKELKKQELQLYVKRVDLLKQQAQAVLEAVNSSDN